MKQKLVTAILFLTVFTFSGCGLAGNQNQNGAADKTSQTSQEELKTVRIGAASATAQLSENALLAKNLGYFDEELKAAGYQAEYIGFAGAGPAINEAFAADELDYAFYVDFPAITAKSNGVDVKVIGIANQEMNNALFVTEKSGIQSAADMEGKKIIVTPGTILYKYFAELCEDNQVDINQVELVNAISDAQAVLASGDADGLIISLGGAKMYETMGLGKVVADSTTNPSRASLFTLTGRSEYINQHPETAKALLRALKRAAEYAQQNPEDACKQMETESTSEEAVKATYAYDMSFSYFSPQISDECRTRAQSVYHFAKENNMLGGDVNLEELFDSSYVDEVLSE